MRFPVLLVILTFVVEIMVCNLFADAPATQPQTDAQRMASWWDDLEKPEPDASRALLQFADRQADAVAFFKEHLLPLTISEEEVNKLIADLSSDDDAVWKPAFEKLEYFDPRIAIDLPTLMNNTTEPAARSRLVALLCDYSPETFEGKSVELRPLGDGENFNFFTGVAGNGSSWWAESKVSRLGMGNGATNKQKWLRALRAIDLLQHISSPEAIAILKNLATGHPDASPTKAAIAALEAMGTAK